MKLWEVFWKDRLALRTTYSFDGRPEEDDTITVVNLSTVPVQVSHWSLRWTPRRWWSSMPIKDVTPDHTYPFKIDGRDSYALVFKGLDKFDWSFRNSEKRRLILVLHIFGRRRPKLLRVTGR